MEAGEKLISGCEEGDKKFQYKMIWPSVAEQWRQ